MSIGLFTNMSAKDFDPFEEDVKDGYFIVPQSEPGVAVCPGCGETIDVKRNQQVKDLYATLKALPCGLDSWAAAPICCAGFWCVYSPVTGKWSFRRKT